MFFGVGGLGAIVLTFFISNEPRDQVIFFHIEGVFLKKSVWHLIFMFIALSLISLGEIYGKNVGNVGPPDGGYAGIYDSLGNILVYVPDLIGKDPKHIAAIRTIKDAGFTIKVIGSTESSVFDKGRIVSQDPLPYVRVKKTDKGTEIKVTISLGKK